MAYGITSIDVILAENNFIRVGEYSGKVTTPTLLKCERCGNNVNMRISSILAGQGCKICARKANAIRISEPIENIDSRLMNLGIVRNGIYAGNQTKHTPLRCNRCNNVWAGSVVAALRTGCKVCTLHGMATPIERVDSILLESELERSGNYSGSVTKPTPVKCLVCSHTWNTRIHNVSRGHGCPVCSWDRTKPNGIYHLNHPDIPHQYIGISYKPKSRLKQHQEDRGPRGGLARELKTPYEFTVSEIHDVLETATSVQDDVAAWHAGNPFGRVDYGAVVHDTPFDELPTPVKSKPARVPRFVAEWIETELIRHLSVNFPADNPFSAAGKVKLVNIAKNFPADAISA